MKEQGRATGRAASIHITKMRARIAVALLALASSAAAFSPMLMCDASVKPAQADKPASAGRRDILKAGAFSGLAAAAAEIATASSEAAAPILRTAPTAAQNVKNAAAPVFSIVEKGGTWGIEAAEEMITASESHAERVLQELMGKL